MKRLLGLLLVMGMVGCGGGGEDPHPLGKFGAKIDRNEQGEIIRVRLTASHITDAGLMHLKGLTNLTALYLGYTQITDAGLIHLQELPKLESLDLRMTKVTDAGLVHIKGLTNLEKLNLTFTKVTDAGLVHLDRRRRRV